MSSFRYPSSSVPDVMHFTRCDKCGGRCLEEIPCRTCAGRGYFESTDPVPILRHDDNMRTAVVTEEILYRVREILRTGITYQAHRRAVDEAVREARLQGRVDVGVREIARRLTDG